MRTIKLVIILIINLQLSLSSVSLASGTSSIVELEKQVEIQMKFHDLMLRLGSEIDDELRSIPASEIETRNLEVILKKNVDKISDFYAKNLHLNITTAQKLKKLLLTDINYKKVQTFFTKVNIGTHVFFKRHGIGLTIAIVLGMISDVVIAGGAGFLGLHVLAALSPFIPYSVMYSTVPRIYHNLTIKLKLSKRLGGSKFYDAYIQQIKLTAKELGLGNPFRFIFPSSQKLMAIKTANGSIETISIAEKNIFKSLVGRVGFNIDELTIQSLTRFLDRNGIEDEFISNIRNSNLINKWKKAGFIINHIFQTYPDDTIALLKKRFANNFVKAKQLRYWKELEPWTMKMVKAKNIKESMNLLKDIPEFIDQREILTIWNEIILPEYANRSNLTYKQYRSLVKEGEVLQGIVYGNPSNWNDEFHGTFLKYVAKSIDMASIGTCRNGQGKVLRFLTSAPAL